MWKTWCCAGAQVRDVVVFAVSQFHDFAVLQV